MTNIEKLFSQSGLSHSKLSQGTGRKGNWFNDAYNNNEDIHISTLAKLLSVIEPKLEFTEKKISEIFDDKVIRISSLIRALSDENELEVPRLLRTDAELIIDLIGDWGFLEAKKKLSSEESEVFHYIRLTIYEEKE